MTIIKAAMKNIIFLLFAAIVFAQDYSVVTQATIPGTKDVLMLINEVDPGLYSGFKIIRDEKAVFTFNQGVIEIEAFSPLLHKVISDGRKFIILNVCGRPTVGWYLCLEQVGAEYRLFGETPKCTTEIFGDIDSDGIFEIGLTNPLHESLENKEAENRHYLENVKVIELKDNFPVDEKLTDLYVSKMLMK